MLLRLPRSLHYPVTITKVLKQAGSSVAKHENLLLYSYQTTVREGSRDGEDRYVRKSFPATFESALEGTLKFWKVREGDVLAQPIDVAEIEELCPHSVQFGGMCIECGNDMTVIASFNNDANDADRAPLQIAHDTQMLKISQKEALRQDEEAKRRLLASKKLSLVVDLDQTIIHAAVDPTIAEWQKDPDNPNYEAVKDVRSFQLIDDTPGMRGCWYYIKMRPNLPEFLEQVSQLYELHIYTMGTRQYAEQVANVVDPDRKFFGDRILSRDESGSATNKSLARLFPIDTKMVVIIDDRGDVWKWNANLIRVLPFDFFVGIGDINSSFLPKKQEIQSSPPTTEKQDTIKEQQTAKDDGDGSTEAVKQKPPETVENGAPTGAEGTDTSALEQLVAMGGGNDPVVREQQSKGQEETIAAQLEEKPLLQMQKLLDAEDQAATAETGMKPGEDTSEGRDSSLVNGDHQNARVESEPSSSSSSSFSSLNELAEPTPTPPPLKPPPVRHSILRDDDRQLASLATRLTDVHAALYSEYDRRRLGHKGGRVAALSGKGKMQLQPDIATPSDDALDLLLVPDIKHIMPGIKRRVLSGVVIVFSSILPLGSKLQTADLSLWAKTFGATIAANIDRETTHVVATNPRTSKVKQAVNRGLWVVGLQWLIDCMTGWKRLKEDNYVLPDLPERKKQTIRDRSATALSWEEMIRLRERAVPFSSTTSEEAGTSTDTDTDIEIDAKKSESRRQEDDSQDRKRLKLDTTSGPLHDRGDDEEGMPAPIDSEAAANASSSIEDAATPLSLNQDEWKDLDKELQEFMDSSDEEKSSGEDEEIDQDEAEDLESTTPNNILGKHNRNSNKRKREAEVEAKHQDDDREERTGRLRNMTTKVPTESGTSTEQQQGTTIETTAQTRQEDDDAGVDGAEAGSSPPPSSSSFGDELARELERELERSSGDEGEADGIEDRGDGGGGGGGGGGAITTASSKDAAGVLLLPVESGTSGTDPRSSDNRGGGGGGR